MNRDRLEDLIAEVLRQEVDEASYCIDGLEDRVVTELDGRLPKPSLLGFVKKMVAPTRAGQLTQLAIVGATAAVFLIIGVFIADKLPVSNDNYQLLTSQASAAGESLFVMPAPTAKSVTVVGNFTGWEAMPLSDEDGDGIWTAKISLSPGRYEYAFVVDGKWWGQDPLADEYVQSFGQYNSVRYIVRAGDEA